MTETTTAEPPRAPESSITSPQPKDTEAKFFERYNRTLRNRVVTALTPLIDRVPPRLRIGAQLHMEQRLGRIILKGEDEYNTTFEMDVKGVKALYDAGLLVVSGSSTAQIDDSGWRDMHGGYRVDSYSVALRPTEKNHALVDVALRLEAERVKPDLGEWRADFTRWHLKRDRLQAEYQAKFLPPNK